MSEAVASRRVFYGVSALLFAVSSALTIAWCAAMAAMGGMPMPGGWTMSMAWMRMPGQSWAGVATSFVGMWTVMMAAMMLPSLVPVLWRHHQVRVGAGEPRAGWLTAIAGASYFSVWALFGVLVFAMGAALASVAMREPALARAAPIAAGVVVLIAGVLQFSRWKAHHLECWRAARGDGRTMATDAPTAWRHGVRLGIHCITCSLGPTAVLLVMGVMDVGAMAVIGAAITVERVAPRGERIARVTGAVAVAASLFLIARAGGIG